MKCLRCGKTMKNGETECECGHFYDNNLHGKRIINKKKSKRSITLIEILAIIIILSMGIMIFFSFVVSKNNKHSNTCDIKCEGYSYEIKNNKCICSNGEEYPIE